MALEDIWNGLTEEQRARARSCETPNDMLALAKEEGFELSDDEPEGIAGGGFWGSLTDCTSKDCDKAECVRGTVELTQAPLTDRRAAAKTLLMGPSAIGFHAVVNYSIKSSTPHAAS